MKDEKKFRRKAANGIEVEFVMGESEREVWTFEEGSLVEDLYDFVLVAKE